MKIRSAVSRSEYEKMTAGELRAAFLVEKLFTPGVIDLEYWEVERTVVGSVVPLKVDLELQTDVELASEFFCERRELGVINIGNPGAVTVDGNRFEMGALHCLYIGRGSREVSFSSETAEEPAKFYLV